MLRGTSPCYSSIARENSYCLLHTLNNGNISERCHQMERKKNSTNVCQLYSNDETRTGIGEQCICVLCESVYFVTRSPASFI